MYKVILKRHHGQTPQYGYINRFLPSACFLYFDTADRFGIVSTIGGGECVNRADHDNLPTDIAELSGTEQELVDVALGCENMRNMSLQGMDFEKWLFR
jgi:hypothetical protein